MTNNLLTYENPLWKAWSKGTGQGDSLSFLYSTFLTIGVFVTLIASVIMLRIRKIPLTEVMNATYIVIIAGVLGGSIFGKLGTGVPFYKFFYIWEAGMSFFGAFLCGFVGGFVFLYNKKDNKKVSIWVYADCIVPNVLLGQAIGRWGNLFNHEILGRTTSVEKLQWLPSWIWQRLFYYVDPSTGKETSELVYKEPLFMYEMIATLISWFLIVFVINNLGKWFSKKPWKLDPHAFPVKKAVRYDEIKVIDTYIDIKYKQKFINGEELYKMSKRQAWLKAYFAYQADLTKSDQAQKIIDDHTNIYLKALDKFKNFKNIFKENQKKLQIKMKNNKITKEEFKIQIKDLKTQFKDDTKDLRIKKSRFKSFLTLDSKKLYELNNPNNYFVINCGVATSSYIIFYAIIRLVLDSFRTSYELAFKWSPVFNYMSIVGILILGVISLVIAQFIAPKKWREEGWLYEKSY
ncbi:prolipoprotein diacylglyceryl transferase [Spiroplasma gladiatoris]|uniref:Prolipoprotein diacylglyceryl transferase n=1 Tax=Spiroplasma gladiatoris TaxID=2143 RepID=A0A4P7AGS3_9MOLU|nr:prolipoprotein diacylglyceryl transferase family protein [Spiroplasma gladiatoris]QBQ07291.1 prolipoprotein diacylglyceryl transferase [Spiroplasma gladiatoris]